MNNRLFSALLFFFLLLPSAPACAKTVVIYHTSDVHGFYSSRPAAVFGSTSAVLAGGFAALSAIAKKEQAPVILLDSGDWFTGTPEGDLTRGLASVRLMNAAGYTAALIGNHEFDHGEEALEADISSAVFRVLGANIFRSGARVPYAAPYMVAEAGGERIAVIGITNPRTPGLTAGDVSGLSFPEEKETLLELLPEVEKLGVDAVVLLVHDGIYTGDFIDGANWTPPESAAASGTLALARAAAGRVQVILGGHMHTLLTAGYKDSATGTVIGESGWGLLYASRVELSFDDKTGKFTGASDRAVPILVAAAGEDPAVLAVLEPLKEKIAARMNTVIGEAAEDLPEGPRGAVFPDSPLGSLFCDMIRDYAGTQIVIQNTEGLRAGLKKGPVTFRALYEAAPFDAELVTLRLSGARLEALLRESLSEGSPAVQVSGIELEYSGARDGTIKDLSVRAGGKPLEAQKTYSVAANDFFLRSPRWRALTAGKYEKKGTLIRDIVVSAIKSAGKPLTAPAPGRIKRTAI